MVKVVVVMGTGFRGAGCARTLSDVAESVVFVRRASDDLSDSGSAVPDGVTVVPLPGKECDPDTYEVAVEHIETVVGPVDVWVTLCHVTGTRTFGEITPADTRAAVEAGYLAPVHAAMAVLERMTARDRGTVVHVVREPDPDDRSGRTHTLGVGRAVRGFHDALTAELAADGSSVSSVLLELPVDAAPEDVAGAVAQVVRDSTQASRP